MINLEIAQQNDTAIGKVYIRTMSRKGVTLWQSPLKFGTPLSAVVEGMRDYPRSVSDDLAEVLGGSIDG